MYRLTKVVSTTADGIVKEVWCSKMTYNPDKDYDVSDMPGYDDRFLVGEPKFVQYDGVEARKVRILGMILYFSYTTLIAYRIPEDSDLIVSENLWSRTTGGHIKELDKNLRRQDRLPRDKFIEAYNYRLKRHLKEATKCIREQSSV